MHIVRCTVTLAVVCWLFLSGVLAHAQTSAQTSAQSVELRVGSKRFTESYILAQVVAQTARTSGAAVQVKQGLGNTAIVYEALRSGQIDVYAEYTGTIALEIIKDPTKKSLTELNQALAPLGLAAGVPLGFNDGYALAMRRDQAQQLGIRNLSDLARHPQLRFGLSNEFMGRADGWAGLASRYQIKGNVKGLDHALAYQAIAQQQIDVMDIYTTDAKIEHLGLLVLQDDLNYFPRYDAVLLYRQNLPQQNAAAWSAVKTLEGRISESQMIHMNAQAELQSLPFEVIAQQFLAGEKTQATPKTTESFSQQFWTRLVAPDLWRLVGQHLLLVLVSVGAATLIAVPLGIVLFPHARLRGLAVAAAGIMQTIPSLALLAVLIAILGVIGRVPALLALTAYSILPILSNTCAGLAEVSPGLRQAGSALGMTQPQRMRWIELPIAMPTVIAGIRTACAIAIGTATIAAFIGAGGLGERIVTGLALNDNALMLAGALPSAALALLSELVFESVERYLRRKRAHR